MMTDLTPTQMQVLNDLIAHGGTMVVPMEFFGDDAIHLCNAGLLKSVVIDSAKMDLRITDAGRSAFGLWHIE